MLTNDRLLIVCLILAGTLGCGLFSSKTSDTEVVFAPTEVGTPEGDKVTKDIGPAGGTLASPDGRLTLTVPQNALTDTFPFSIQPITNKAEGGLGLAYRLEPNGKTFTTPLELSVSYDDHDLEGTVPEALSMAYQDQQGAWHPREAATLDQNAKMLTVTTTHFTDWSFLSRLRIYPEKATLRVGETLRMKLTPCYVRDNLINRFKKFFGAWDSCEVTDKKYYWDILPNWFADIGTIDKPNDLHVIYTAPPKKPTPNIATVSLPYALQGRGDGEYLGILHRGMFTAHITIVDKGYRASGSDGPNVYSGTVCELDKPFTLTDTNGPLVLTLAFTPSSGTATARGTYFGGTWTGTGPYTITGVDTKTPEIIYNLSTTITGRPGSTSGIGVAHIHLTDDDTVDCK